MGTLEQIAVYPVKGLGRVLVDDARVLEGGTLEHDREFALFDADGDVINGKRTERVHDVDTSFDAETGVLTVSPADGESREFDLDTERDEASEWFGAFFEAELTLKRDRTVGFVDRRQMGPSVVSTATLREVASWFDGMTVESMRRRLRANVEVGGVPAFWEDRFVGPDAPSFVVGDVRFDGVTPCGRCVVPQRDPDTGEPTPRFRERFVERRRKTFPEWADETAFDHLYTLMILTEVPEHHRGARIHVGDSVRLTGE